MKSFKMHFLWMALGVTVPFGQVFAAGSWLRNDPAPTKATSGVRAPQKQLQSVSHKVSVRITDGFAQTQVHQIWTNPNPQDLEATYELPLPKQAALSAMRIRSGETELEGEVQRKAQAEKTYQEEKDAGEDAGLAEQNDRHYRFRVARIPGNGQVSVKFTYSQPLTVDTGVVRYHYAISDATRQKSENKAADFWEPKSVHPAHTVELEATVRSAWEITSVRVAGSNDSKEPAKDPAGTWRAQVTSQTGKDIVLYYKLAEDLPGRVEVHTYRSSTEKPGTFMAVLTPGVDLPLISETGGDHVFVLDISGSMRATFHTLKSGVSRAIRSLTPLDRFQLLTFDTQVYPLTPSPLRGDSAGRQHGLQTVSNLSTRGGTDLYKALQAGLQAADTKRATHLVLVTDGQTNQGHTDKEAFAKLVRETDVRIHGFLLGKRANWPLMDTITKASGGQSYRVSESDDLGGVLLLAKEKLKSQALHDVKVSFRKTPVHDLTDVPARLFHGEQLVVFGRYDKPGVAELTLETRISGTPKQYTVRFDLPALDKELPELERLWAMARVEDLKRARDEGRTPEAQANEAIAALGVATQIVTDQTSMVLLSDSRFQARGIERKNQARLAIESTAQARRLSKPVRRRQIQTARRVFPKPAPHVATIPTSGASGTSSPSRSYRGGGAFDPFSGALLLGLLALAGKKEEAE